MLRSRHQYNVWVDSDVTERAHPGEMDNGANRECWRAGKIQAEAGEERGRRTSWEQRCRPGKREFVVPGAVFAPGPAFREFGMGMEKLPEEDISEHSFQGQCTEPCEIPSISEKPTLEFPSL